MKNISMEKQPSRFKESVLRCVSQIPRGKVASYGQIAAASGSPRAARQVGGILRAIGPDNYLPWWRVVNNQGLISIKGNWIATKDTQKKMLKDEGVEVRNDYSLDIEKYRHRF